MKYKININPLEKIVFDKLHKQLNGLTKTSQRCSYSGECLLLKFSRSERWLHYAYFDSNTGKAIAEGTISVSPERSVVWLYVFLKDELKYAYIDTIFPSSVFN